MRLTIAGIFCFICCSTLSFAQATFKAGWNTYKTGWIIHQYNYNYAKGDSSRLFPADSARILVSSDSAAVMTISYPEHDKNTNKTVNYFNIKKQLTKTEEYTNENLINVKEWGYDDAGRKISYIEQNKNTGNTYKKNYDYTTDKKTKEVVMTESSSYNGRIEFYTRTYFDKTGKKTKEVRMNDNNKDVVHIESFIYGENGKVRERSVFFPEWKVTKKFQEKEGNELPKCFRTMPVGTAEKPTLAGRVPYIRKLLLRNTALLNDADCNDFEYTFRNFTNCDIIISSTNASNTKKITFLYKEKQP
jgi:hypothetical protein